MRILGVDPGTRSMGYGLIDVLDRRQLRSVCYGAWRPGAKLLLYQRLGCIQQQLEAFLQEHRPDVVVLEKSFSGNNIKTAINIGEARGVVLSMTGRFDIELMEYTPTSVKNAIVGAGRAGKEQVQKMVGMLLGVHDTFETDDESDALALAITYVQREGHKICTTI